MNWFCTHFDIGYLPQGQALHLSLMRHGGDFTLIILCLDTEVEEQLRGLNLPRTQLVPLSLLEASDPRLLTAKSGRRKAEYYFTLKPCLCRHVMDTMPEVDFLTYVDSDVFFFSACNPWVTEMRGSDAVVVPHRFPAHSAWREIFGRFNAGCVGFRRSEAGLAALTWWHERCLEWCHDVPDGDRFADQKYLNVLADQFPGVQPSRHSGVNVAPWNLDESELSIDGQHVLVQGKPLVFYHFSGVQRQSRHIFDAGLGEYGSAPGPISRDHIFLPYFRALISFTTNHATTPKTKKRNTDTRSLSSTIIVSPSLDSPQAAEMMAAYAAELEQFLLAAEERNNQNLLACDASIRALDAGGFWLRETARHAESQCKQSLKRNAELEKALHDQPTKKVGWLAGWGSDNSKGGNRPASVGETGSAPSPPSPDQVLAQLTPRTTGPDTSPSLPDGVCLFIQCSVRALGRAVVLAAKGHRCVVLGCPGWLKKGSTANLVFLMERLAEQLAHKPDFLSDCSAVMVDYSDRAWAQPLLDAASYPRQKVYYLGRSRGYQRGLDIDSPMTPLEMLPAEEVH